MVVPVGLEPTTLALSTRCSNQLSYGTVTRNWFWACHPKPSLGTHYPSFTEATESIHCLIPIRQRMVEPDGIEPTTS